MTVYFKLRIFGPNSAWIDSQSSAWTQIRPVKPEQTYKFAKE